MNVHVDQPRDQCRAGGIHSVRIGGARSTGWPHRRDEAVSDPYLGVRKWRTAVPVDEAGTKDDDGRHA